MLVRGDLNKVLAEVNKVLEGAFARIQALEDKLQGMENPTIAAIEPSRRRGRPPGSKNKAKEAA